tara:strand:+ start:50 stop:610 length:561 start_codon:yes stop_codon:yes gene_type:complete
MSIRYVIDDALPQDIYLELEDLITGEYIEWFLKIGTVGKQTNFGDWRFIYNVYQQGSIPNQKYPYFKPVFDFLNPKALMGSKLNCDIYTQTPQQRPWHTDQPYNTESTFTSIMYFNDCNGKTIFKEDNVAIESKRNRMLIFNSGCEHAGITQTDEPRRYVLNTNFFADPKTIPTGKIVSVSPHINA